MNTSSKKVFAQNLQYYMDINKKSRYDICDALPQIRYSALGEWLRGSKFPRIDKIELLADYFRISKSDLIEPRNNTSPIITVNNTGDNNNITGGIIDSNIAYSAPKQEKSCTDYINDAIRQVVKESSVDIDIDAILNNRLSDEALSLAKAYDKIQDRNAKKLLWDITQKILDKQDAC